MNRLHRWLCRSDHWRGTVAERLSWAIGDTDLGPNVLEIGPGPGLTTDLLRTSVARLTALEIDPSLASSLNSRLKGSNVQVIEGDAARMPFGDSEFSGAVSFTMLHHVPSEELQNKVLEEVFRVLKPGGFFVGSDSLQSWFMRIIHIGDTLVPVNPDTFEARLASAGFEVFRCKRTRKHSDSVRDNHQRRRSKREWGNEIKPSVMIRLWRSSMNKLIVILKSSPSKLIFLTVGFGLLFATSGLTATASDSCNSNPANRQLDYWLGNWKVGTTGNAHSNVTLSLDKCMVVENWDGGRGHRGQNVFVYSADDKSWYGMFADNEGRVHVFTSGKVTDGTAEFAGTSRGPNGESILNRVKVTRVNPNKVEQTWEKSNDNGATWNVVFRGEYSRANP